MDNQYTDVSEAKIFDRYVDTYNLRGFTTTEIVADIQRRADEMAIEEDFNTRYDHERWIRKLSTELERREKLPYDGTRYCNKSIIQAIKEKIRIEDVINWYAPVDTYKKQWWFCCPVHGDKHPSAKIYQGQGKWYCFGCNKGGDIFDAVMFFERVDMPTALRKLAKHVGLNLKDPKPSTVGKKGFSKYD